MSLYIFFLYIYIFFIFFTRISIMNLSHIIIIMTAINLLILNYELDKELLN